MATEFTGAEIVVKCLQEEKVEHVFGYPGGAVLYIYDALYKQDTIQHVLVRHEQAAVHAGDLVHAHQPGQRARDYEGRALGATHIDPRIYRRVRVAADSIEGAAKRASRQQASKGDDDCDSNPGHDRQAQDDMAGQSLEAIGHLMCVDPFAIGHQENYAAVDRHGAKGHDDGGDADLPD